VLIHELTATELRKKISAREISATEAATAFLKRIEQVESKVDAFLLVDSEGALAQARAVDEKIARGEVVGRLAGVPIAIKDNMCTRGLRTTCASKILQPFIPPYDADVVERLRREDAVILGKTNMDEFAMGSSCENSSAKPTRNPWALDRVPGGSSGGSAAAVAARMTPLALGSDTGGSIRQPAALCGIVGLKPTYGRVSRYGLIAFASSLDQIGPLATDARDAALLSEVISGYDRRDSTSVDIPVPEYTASLTGDLRGMRIGVPKEHFGKGLDSEVELAVRTAMKICECLGAELVEVSLPHSEHAVATYYIVAPAEASSNLARYDGAHYGYRTEHAENIIELYSRTRAEGFGPEVQRRILLGTYALSTGYYDAYYLKAAKVRRLIKQDFDRAFEKVDFIIGPTSPSAAFRIGERKDDPLAMYLADVYTIAVNLAGIAAIALPCGFSREGLPIGMQIVAKEFEEARLLQAAWAYQEVTDWHRRMPTL
jgi:aspartyl-tRNA(Asn)/glutamyl-tRNA(Gln) amidotransferase subunit A